MSAEPLRVVLCWHMHQPDYRNPLTGEWLAPWTYLHACKDYSDMAAHLETAPASMRAVVNLPPVLLEQITDHAKRLQDALASGSDPGEPLLAALLACHQPAEPDLRRRLLSRCLQAHDQHMIGRFPPFQRLAAMARVALETSPGPDYLTDRHLEDLITWYHLAWLGETARRRDQRVQALIAREQGYGTDERHELASVILETLSALPDRYAALAAGGRIELATSPFAHPMLPLLLDFNAAREARPESPLPECERYPDGQARAAWHLEQAQRYWHERSDVVPVGCWPAEGGVSAATLALIGRHEFQWTASGEAVLCHSLEQTHLESDALHRPYRLQDQGPACFFRDDTLSDCIGFIYKDWHGDDAVSDFIARLEHIASQGDSGRVVSVILDGENPWEHYPDNGFHFVPALYQALSAHPGLRLTTFAEVLSDPEVEVRPLTHLVAGSWVHGDFDTWIGDPDKNRAWDLLCAAKAACDARLPAIDDPDQQAAISRQLAICEGSDWYWWPGDYNPDTAVFEFDHLFRQHLRALYGLLDVTPPPALQQPFSHGHGRPELGGTMRRGKP